MLLNSVLAYLADPFTLTGGWAVFAFVGTMLFGTGGTTAAIITGFATRRKTRAETESTLVQSVANIVGPYNMTLAMQREEMVEQKRKIDALTHVVAEQDREIHERNDELNIQTRKLRLMEERLHTVETTLRNYVERYGPLDGTKAS